jgi:hypothetical protein
MRLLDRLLSRPGRRQACSIFTAKDRDIARMDVSVGPCVPMEGRKKPLAGPFGQLQLTVVEVAALLPIVVRDPVAGPWASETTRGHGRLVVFSDEFAAALAQLSRRYQLRPKDDPVSIEWVEAVVPKLAERWVSTGVASNWADIGISVAAGTARSAENHGQKLFAWFGPKVPASLSPRAMDRL